MTASSKPLLRIGEAAAYLGRSRVTIYQWIKKGLLHKVPGTHSIAMKEIERFLAEPPRSRKRGRYKVGGRK